MKNPIRAIILLASLSVFCTSGAIAHPGHGTPPWQQSSAWPDRIVVTLPDDPATSFAVTWRTSEDVESAVAEIAFATPDARFDLAAESRTAASELLDLATVNRLGADVPVEWNTELAPVRFHSVTFEGLEPDTLYAYRVRGAEGAWSEWYQVRTAPVDGPISFIYVGDAQNGILSHWSRTIRAAFQTAPDARFILHAGDLVNRASRDFEWAEWFKAVGFIHGMIPAIPVAGNHEYDRIGLPEDATSRILSILWRPQFTLPLEEILHADLQETVYDVRYTKDLHLFVLDTQGGRLEEQAEWLDAALTASDARWRIVSMHHPIFSSGRGRDNADRREILLPIFLKHNVDLVLQGHDHTYARGQIPQDDIAQTPERIAMGETDLVKTMFVNSVSGAKQYTFKDDRWDGYASDGVELKNYAENTQFFQVIRIYGDTLGYTAYTATGEIYDSFTMTQGKDAVKTLLDGNGSTIDLRLFEGTMPYPGVNDLGAD
jgi:3',5'-cyclic AMP phosphodiesterase CpdA